MSTAPKLVKIKSFEVFEKGYAWGAMYWPE